MRTLHGIPHGVEAAIIGKVAEIGEADGWSAKIASAGDRTIASLGGTGTAATVSAGIPYIDGIGDISLLKVGDVVSLDPTGRVTVLLSAAGKDNSLVVTERCNCACVMCPQVSATAPTSLLDRNRRIVSLIPRTTEVLGLTGGEPTAVPDELAELLTLCKERLPDTKLELLTNGIALDDPVFVRRILAVGHPGLSFHVPLYSDAESVHDAMVGARGFHRTLQGLFNLARTDQRVEVRNVVTALNYRRLPQWASFVARNLPFASHAAIMGLEPVGRASENIGRLWIEPRETVPLLTEAVSILRRADVPVSLYGHQLCVLPESLWKHSRRAISEWKNICLPICKGCDVLDACGGFFASQGVHHSRHLRPVRIGGSA
jgi:His-Xaa-Ser system radical SAM maturase HxsC